MKVASATAIVASTSWPPLSGGGDGGGSGRGGGLAQAMLRSGIKTAKAYLHSGADDLSVGRLPRCQAGKNMPQSVSSRL